MDVERQTSYWAESGCEDLEAAHALLEQGKIRHGLFFAHLALEKILKACVCQATSDLPPRIHSLLMLAAKANVELDDQQKDFLAQMERFQLAGRYPGGLISVPLQEEAGELLRRSREVFEWFRKRL